MKSGARQLLLEVLLLRERYTNDDFDRVSKFLSGSRNERELLALSELLVAFTPTKADKPSTSPTDATDPSTAKQRFLTSLKGRRSAASSKRMRAILKRLGLPEKEQSRYLSDEDMLSRITELLDRMSDDQLSAFLKPYKVNPPADEGYLGLANYIMHKGE